MSDSVSYTPVFQPPNWTDNVDRVSAGGPNGFNIQFIGLTNELTQISNTFAQVSTILDELGKKVSRTITLTFAPTFQQEGSDPNWLLVGGVAVNPGPNANGWLSLQLPDGASLQTITVFGQKKGNVLSLQLNFSRQALLDLTPTPINILSLKDFNGPFQQKAAIPDAFALIDNSTYKYLVFTSLAATNPPDPTVSVTISAIQIVCTT